MKIAPTSRSTGKAVAVGLVSGLLIAAPALWTAILSGGAGHGQYLAARALFPIPMLLTLLQNEQIGPVSIVAALAQFPAYGAFVGWANLRERRVPLIALALAHVAAAAACFAGTLPNFS